jgi:hypothetical protein
VSTEPLREPRHMPNTYGARESVRRSVPCLPDERQLLPAFHVQLPRASCRLPHIHPDLASRPNSQFPSSQRRLDTSSFLQPRLLPDAVQRTYPEIVTGLARYCNQSRLRRMFVLAMTASRAIKTPSVAFQFLDHIPHLHFTPRCKPSRIDRNTVYAIRRVQHSLGQGRMSVDGPHQVFHCSLEFHGYDSFGD